MDGVLLRIILYSFTTIFVGFFPIFKPFSFVFLSHLFPLANAEYCRICGVQPLQPSGLQQLQTGREPKQQQSGNGMNIVITKPKTCLFVASALNTLLMSWLAKLKAFVYSPKKCSRAQNLPFAFFAYIVALHWLCLKRICMISSQNQSKTAFTES